MKPRKYREIAKTLTGLGCTHRQGKGDHEVWTCPCGAHQTVLTQKREISAGVLRTSARRLACISGEGWWK
ncbi:MAG: hypothetical protein U0904_02380 [Candidatus Nanopelagicales bacterium]|nr:hypothetical protein [Candidatus Nanopelagicales bacterium]